MAIYIRDKETDRIVRELALARGIGVTEAVREAARKDLDQTRADRRAKLQAIVDKADAKMSKYPDTGLKADKAFYDWLSGEE